jgi:cytochrome b involved in lipid metabolism
MNRPAIGFVSTLAVALSLVLGVASVQAAPNTTKQITWQQVKKNNKASSCWTVINGKVYNVTPWIRQHPGGSQRILALCGKNGSSMFRGQHAGQSAPENILKSYQIGVLRKKR